MLSDGFQRLDRRFIDVRQIVGLITSAVLAVLALVALVSIAAAIRPSWSLIGLGAAGWVLATAALTWRLYTWPAKSFEYASYRLDADGLEIRRGVIWRTIINVPRTRVQHTDVSQGPVERSHGLSTLVIHTAGTDHAQVVLPGLSREDAIALRDQLLPRDGRDAV